MTCMLFQQEILDSKTNNMLNTFCNILGSFLDFLNSFPRFPRPAKALFICRACHGIHVYLWIPRVLGT